MTGGAPTFSKRCPTAGGGLDYCNSAAWLIRVVLTASRHALLVWFVAWAAAPAAAADKIYWAEGTAVRRANLDGSQMEDVLTQGLANAWSVAIDNSAGKLYVADHDGVKIVRSNLDGSGIEFILTNVEAFPFNIALSNTSHRVYWTGNSSIYYADKDGGQIRIAIPSFQGHGVGLAVDDAAGKIYWTRTTDAAVSRANLDGSNVEALGSPASRAENGVVLDTAAGKMYWADANCNFTCQFTGIVYRANLDGSGKESFLTRINQPSGLAFDPNSRDLFFSVRCNQDIIGNCVGKGFLYSINVDTGAGGGPILRADIFGSMAIASSTLQITSTSLPAVKLATNSSYQLKAIFGNPPYSWVVVGGTLPRGMALSSGGIISGTPAEAGEFAITVRVVDAGGASADKVFVQRVLLMLPPPDIRVHKSGTRVVPGRTAEYFITVENVGVSTATSIDLVEVLDPLTAFRDPSSASPNVAIVANSIRWNIPSLEPSETTVLNYAVTIAPTVAIGGIVKGDAIEMCNACKSTDACRSFGTICQMVGDPIPFSFRKTDLIGQMYSQLGFPPDATCVAAIEACATECRNRCSSGGDDKPAQGAVDPNEIVVSPRNFITSGQTLLYAIHFENVGTVEARDVFISDSVDPNLDLTTVRILAPATATLDPIVRRIYWTLTNENLPPGGSDSVLVTVKPRSGLPSGTQIRNQADIQFDVFNPMTTNEVVNIIDDVPPDCNIAQLPAQTASAVFGVSWSGTDAVGEIDSYSVWVAEDGGAFAPLLENTKGTSTNFQGVQGKRYGFLCVAKDTAGNIEIKPAAAETTIQVLAPNPADVNGDGKVDCADLAIIKASFGKRRGQTGFDARADVNNDGIVDVKDLAFVSRKVPAGTKCP